MTTEFVISYILSILFLMVGIGWIVVCGSRNRATYSFMIIELMLVMWLVSQLIIISAANDVQYHIGYYMCSSAVCMIGSVWLFFALNFVKYKIPPLAYGIIIGVPVIHIILLYTNSMHLMFYSSMEFVSSNRGIFFWTNFAYTYGAMLIGLVVIWLNCLKNKLYRKTVSFMLTLSVAAPLILNFLYVSGTIKSTMDLTPVAFTFSALVMLMAVKNFGFLNINGMALDKIFSEISQGVIVYTMDDKISYCNRLGQKYYELINTEDKSQQEWEISHNDSFYSVKKLLHYNRLGKAVAYSLVISDVTRYYELIKKNNELSAAKSALQAERERNIIAQQLHDTIGHTLTKINTLARMSGIDNMDYASQIEEIATKGIVELRETVNIIKDNKLMLMTDSLKPLIKTKGININLTVQGQDSDRYIPLTEVVYRSVMEAITNALKYSNAENMDIILRFKETAVEVFIFDDGKGCENINMGNGLTGIQNRVRAVNGNVSFSSIVNEGFQIIIKLPLK